jgi:hypothetical protein
VTKDIVIFVIDADNNPATSLNPIIRIRNLKTGILIVDDLEMSNALDGFYKYTLQNYNYKVSYSIRINTGLTGALKWRAGGIESVADDVKDALGTEITSAVETGVQTGTGGPQAEF